MENAGIFYPPLEYITAVWYILWSFGTFVVIWYNFSPLWYIVSRKIWQPFETPQPAWIELQSAATGPCYKSELPDRCSPAVTRRL
jgi:hypothetical protein